MNNIIYFNQIRTNKLCDRISLLLSKRGIRCSYISRLGVARLALMRGSINEAEIIIRSVEKNKSILDGMPFWQSIENVLMFGATDTQIDEVMDNG